MVDFFEDYNFTFMDKMKFGYYYVYHKVSSALFNAKMRFQKMIRGYSDTDIWNVDMALSEQISVLIPKMMQDNSMMPGFPFSLSQNVLGDDEYDAEDEEMVYDHWMNNLQIIIHGFEYKSNAFDEDDLDGKGHTYYRAKILLFKYFDDLWT